MARQDAGQPSASEIARDKVGGKNPHAAPQEHELPNLEQQKGFGGITVGVNRRSGQAVAVALWETEGDMRESEKVADQARERAVATAKPERDPVVDHYEVVFQK